MQIQLEDQFEYSLTQGTGEDYVMLAAENGEEEADLLRIRLPEGAMTRVPREPHPFAVRIRVADLLAAARGDWRELDDDAR